MNQNRLIRGITKVAIQLSSILLLAVFLSACSNNVIHQWAASTPSVEVNNHLPKNIQLVNIQTNQLSSGFRINGNLKFSSRKCRNSRPKGTLLINVTKADGTEITNRHIKLNRKGRMSNYSQFDVTLNGTLPVGSHLYLRYMR